MKECKLTFPLIQLISASQPGCLCGKDYDQLLHTCLSPNPFFPRVSFSGVDGSSISQLRLNGDHFSFMSIHVHKVTAAIIYKKKDTVITLSY